MVSNSVWFLVQRFLQVVFLLYVVVVVVVGLARRCRDCALDSRTTTTGLYIRSDDCQW